MEVEIIHRVDTDGESYHYECDVYSFHLEGVVLTARSYEGEDSVQFHSIGTKAKHHLLDSSDFSAEIVIKAIEYFYDRGIKDITYLSDCGYKVINR